MLFNSSGKKDRLKPPGYLTLPDGEPVHTA